MSNRERWIVYPLLFYALVMGFKATYQDPLEFRCRTIECQQLNVRMINGTSVLAAWASPAREAIVYSVVAPGENTESPAPVEAASGQEDADDDVPTARHASRSAGPIRAGYHPPAEDNRDLRGEPPDSGVAPPSADSQ